LLHLFPNIGLEMRKFHQKLPGKYWADLNNQKELLVSFSKEHGFDPLVSENWYSVHSDVFSKYKGASSVLSYYGGSMTTAVLHLFKDIGLDASKFPNKLPSKYWTDPSHQRQLFYDFAKEKGFDPLVPDHWYSVTSNEILSFKGGSSMLSHYDGRFVRALLHLFPGIGFDKRKFHQKLPRNHWSDIANRRKFFEQFAKKRKFDPLIPRNWYSVSKENILAIKKSVSLLSFYDNNLGRALFHLFPEIELDPNKL